MGVKGVFCVGLNLESLERKVVMSNGDLNDSFKKWLSDTIF